LNLRNKLYRAQDMKEHPPSLKPFSWMGKPPHPIRSHCSCATRKWFSGLHQEAYKKLVK